MKIKTDSLSKVAATVGKPTSEHTKDEREDSSVLNKSIRPHLSPNHYQAEAERLTEKPAHQPKRPRWLDLWDNTSTQCICGSPQDPGVEVRYRLSPIFTANPTQEMSSPIIQPKGEEGKMKPSSEKPMTPYLLRLPPELRWQIYGYLFDTRRVEVYIARNKDPNSKRPINRLYCRQLRPRDPKTQFAPTVGAFNDRPFPMGLIYSCRAIYVETVLQLYLKTQFIFNSTKTVARFLKTTKRYAQASIQHVELNHVMYNEPRLTEFRYYKLRSDMAWYMVCDEMSLYFKSLKVLYATMTVWDWPIRLEVGERWSLPLLFFGRDNGVEYVNVKLDMAMFNEKKLKDASAAMEEKMMNPKTYQIREDAKMARELAGPVKTKVLKLVI